jgi:hypothetical protein
MRTTPKAGMGYQLVLPKKVTTHIFSRSHQQFNAGHHQSPAAPKLYQVKYMTKQEALSGFR